MRNVMDIFLMIVNLVTTAAFLYSFFTGHTYNLFRRDVITIEKEVDDVENSERVSAKEEEEEKENSRYASYVADEYNDHF